MKEYEAGRESSLLEFILGGLKTVEVRLNKDKFAMFKPGDHVRLREDVYQNGKIIKEIPDRAVSEIVKINRYDSFQELFETEGLTSTLPGLKTVPEAIKECQKFYSEQEEKRYGVLAIHFRIIKKPTSLKPILAGAQGIKKPGGPE